MLRVIALAGAARGLGQSATPPCASMLHIIALAGAARGLGQLGRFDPAWAFPAFPRRRAPGRTPSAPPGTSPAFPRRAPARTLRSAAAGVGPPDFRGAVNGAVVQVDPADAAPGVAAEFSPFLGGEWAGWQCEFDATTGALRRVPDQFCGPETVEWGQQPNGFELLTSERVEDGGALARRFLQLLPEEGCAVDDLTAERSASVVDVARLRGSRRAIIFDDDGRDARNEWHLRTIFAVGDDVRARVTLRTTADARAPSPRKPRVRVALEQRWSDELVLQYPEGRSLFRTGLAASWVATVAGAKCFGGVAADGVDADGVRWLPGGVGLRIDDGLVRVAARCDDGVVVAVDRVFNDAGDLVDVRLP